MLWRGISQLTDIALGAKLANPERRCGQLRGGVGVSEASDTDCSAPWSAQSMVTGLNSQQAGESGQLSDMPELLERVDDALDQS